VKDFTAFADETRDNDRSLKPSQRGTIAKEPVPAGTQSGAAMARYEHESTEVPLRAQDSLHAQITNKRYLRCAGGRPRHSIEHSKLEAALTSPVPL
jgi:hypothetical protein